MKFKREIALGVEVFLEDQDGFGYCRQHEEVLRSGDSGLAYPGYAIDQVRLCTAFSRETDDLLVMVRTLAEMVEESTGGQVHFKAGRRYDWAAPLSRVWASPEIKALTMPLHDPDEGNSHSVDLKLLANSGSCVVDFDVTDKTPDERVIFWNLLNAVAPVVLHHVHVTYRLPMTKRYLALRYVGRPERVPTGWQWMSGWQEYQEKVLPLTRVFAATESRAKVRSLLANGLFHFAQLLTVADREVVRWWILPTMRQAEFLFTLGQVEDWLTKATRVVYTRRPKSLGDVAAHLPQFEGLLIPADAAPRLQLWEAY